MATLTWREKLAKGVRLTELEQVKYDAERMTLRRIEEQKIEAEIAKERELAKYGNLDQKETPVEAELQPETSKKGN